VSSSSGITGSVRLIERPSSRNKSFGTFVGQRDASGRKLTYTVDESTLDDLLKDAAAQSGLSKNETLETYLETVNKTAEIQKNSIVIPISRITQSIDFDSNSFIKSNIRHVLMPQYRTEYTDCEYSYKNYHTINFFTASNVPSDSTIIYPNIGDNYTINDQFTLDFYINPRYLPDAGAEFNAGAILHMSSSFCLSLHTGSHKNVDGKVDQFRLAIGFKHSANVPPSSISVGIANGSRTFPQDLIYVSEDNMLKHNHWHHVSVRWGSRANNSTGVFQVDSLTSSFYYPSSSILGTSIPQVLFMGNQYIGADDTRKFFNSSAAAQYGVTAMLSTQISPTGFTFNSPLNAEIHDVKIYKRYITNREVDKNALDAASLDEANLAFYVPPFFTNNTVSSQEYFATPVKTIDSGIPFAPFNTDLATQAQIFYPNVQNFLVDLKNPITGRPRLYNLTPAANTTTTDVFAVDHMFKNGQYAKRVYTILPNDNGLFTPSFKIVPESSKNTTYQPYKTATGTDSINLNGIEEMSRTGPTSLGETTVDVINRSNFVSPKNYNNTLVTDTQRSAYTAGNLTTLLSFSGSNIKDSNSNFADRSSNLSTIYQISNLYYGNQIFPESFEISSTALTGSGGKINITLKDNGFGGLYRADAVTPAPLWATIGNIFYNEGLAIIKSPHLYYFGKDNFSVSFNGLQNIHTYTLDAICPAGEINSSSNPSYLSFPPTNEQNETADNFVYITGINIHDDNFNVIMRANLAQPVLKRPDEEFLFRIKYDM
jgi:hypothetical protein